MLATGSSRPPTPRPTAMIDPADRLTCEYDLIVASGMFEEFGYILAQPRVPLGLLPPLGGAPPLRPLRLARAAQPVAGVRPVVVLVHVPRSRPAELVNPLVHFLAEGRHRGHLPGARRASRCGSLPRHRRPMAGAGCACSRVRRGRDRRRHRGRLRPRAEQVRRRLLPGRLQRWRPASSTSSSRTPRAGGRSGTVSTTSAPTPSWLATSWAGTPSRRTTSCSSSTTAATSCAPWTRCSTAWSRGRSTGGGCRPPTTTSRPAS